mmetsp:Transcript_23181/g.22674  ORF Transcript_23181/g.22674 Transcript_23181/m.22674 type:complete len:164 (-) Transcript_23181:204-695(-)
MFQGMKFGLQSAFVSLESGITGVVTQPMEGRKRSGTVGFIKGTAKGVTGLIVKPVSGALDFFSLTTEGLKNSSKNQEELELNKRLRLPRPFYEKDKIIREYDDFHAFLINWIPRFRADINCSQFYDSCMVDCSDQSWSIFFLTLNNMVMLTMQQQRGGSQMNI